MGTRSTSDQKGLSLIEAMLAVGLLAATISVGSYLVVQSQKSSMSLEGGAVCNTRSQLLIQTFANNNNKTNISNWVYSGEATGRPSQAEIGIFSIVSPPGPISGTPPAVTTIPITSPNQINSWELIDASPSWALSLMNAYPTFCDATNAEVTPGHFGLQLTGTTGAFPITKPNFSIYSTPTGLAPPGSTLNNEEDFLNIRMVDAQGNLGCPGQVTSGQVRGTPFPVQLVPTGPNSVNVPSTGSGVSIEVVGTVRYTNNGGQTQYCQSSTKIKTDGDQTPPSFVKPLISMPPPGYCGITSPNLLCVSTISTDGFTSPPSASESIACQPQGVSLTFQVNEPGSVFACQLEYSNNLTTSPLPTSIPTTSPLYICGTPVTIAGQRLSMTVNPYTGSYTNGSGAEVTIQDASGGKIPEGFYKFFVRAYDSAQNYTDQSIDFGVSETNPNLSITPPNPLILGFNPVTAPIRNHQLVKSPWSTAITFPAGDLFQCDVPNSGDTWQATAVAASPTPVFTPSAQWSYNPTSGASIQLGSPAGGCQSNVVSPLALPNGFYTMSALPCTVCGIAVPGATPVTQQWIVDMAPGPTPGQTPSALPLTNFTQTALPTWSFLPAKPAPLPYEYSCQNVPVNTFASSVNPGNSCAPATFLAGTPCSGQGSGGFCSMAFDGCGNSAPTTQTEYQIDAGPGQSCCNVPCQVDSTYPAYPAPGSLTCAMDFSTGAGTCVSTVTGCTKDADCSKGGTCYVAEGTCYGGGSGPAPQTCLARTAPVPTATPIIIAATPTPVGTPPSLGAFACTKFTASSGGGNSASVSCSAGYPVALNGGCQSTWRNQSNYITGNMQNCVNAGPVTASINCCAMDPTQFFQYTSPSASSTSSVACGGPYPFAFNGGCQGPFRNQTDYISSGIQACVQDSGSVTSSINCASPTYAFTCTQATAPSLGNTAAASCPAGYPYALNGGCQSTWRNLSNSITGTTQTCTNIGPVTAVINCCQ